MFRVLLHKLAVEEETASTRLLTGHQAGGSRCGKLPSHSAGGWKPQARYGHGRRVLRALPCGTGGHFLALSSKGGDADRERERERDRASPPASRPKARWPCEPRASPSRPSTLNDSRLQTQPRRGSGLRYEFVRWGRGGQKTRSARAALQWSGLNAAAQPTPTWRPTTTGPSCRTRPEVLTIESATF